MSAGEQVSQGYRQLQAVGPARGPELKTIVCVGLGVVFGILAGTMLADGSWRDLTGTNRHPMAQANPTSYRPATTTAATTPQIQTVPTQVQLDASGPQAPKSLAAVQTLATQALVATSSSVAQALPVAHPVASASKVAATHRTIGAHRHRSGRRLASWRRHFGRHGAISRHKLSSVKEPEIAAGLPVDAAIAPKPAATELVSAFMIEGEVTVSSYDLSAGTIDTFEGESFSLDKTAIAGSEPRGSDVPTNIHYRCDQFWNCSLFVAGQLVPNAKRTR